MTPQEFWELMQGVGFGGAGWVLLGVVWWLYINTQKSYNALLIELREEEKARAERAETRLLDRVSNDTRPLVSEEWRRQLNERAKEREREKVNSTE